MYHKTHGDAENLNPKFLCVLRRMAQISLRWEMWENDPTSLAHALPSACRVSRQVRRACILTRFSEEPSANGHQLSLMLSFAS